MIRGISLYKKCKIAVSTLLFFVVIFSAVESQQLGLDVLFTQVHQDEIR